MNPNSYELDRVARYFLISIIVLVVIGLIMVYSSSYIFAQEIYNNSNYFISKQLLFLTVAVFIAWITSKTKISFWIKYGFHIHMITTLMLVMTFIPAFGNTVKGANRWLSIAGVGIQPGELCKVTFILAMIPFFENFTIMDKNQKLKIILPCLLTLTLLVLQPDFGTFSICFLVISCVAFLSSFPRKYLYSSLIAGVTVAVPVLLAQPYRVQRLFTFLDPWKNPMTSGFQIIQSYLAFANGSIMGLGLGNSNEKLFYLPEAHNDFIFSVVGEELGFLGVVLVIFTFLSFILLGFRVAIKISKRESQILVTSVTFTIGLQAALNMGVVLGLLPTKGLNLPFISSGGSSLITNFFAIGLVMAAVRKERKILNFSFNPGNHNHFPQPEDSYIKKTSPSGFSAYANKTRDSI